MTTETSINNRADNDLVHMYIPPTERITVSYCSMMHKTAVFFQPLQDVLVCILHKNHNHNHKEVLV